MHPEPWPRTISDPSDPSGLASLPVPPGTYARGQRSPIVWVYLCARCAGYAPITPEGYDGALTGNCGGCGTHRTEVHRFRAVIDSAAGCNCTMQHPRMTGDLSATADTMLARALVAAIEDHIGHRAEKMATPLIEDAAQKAREMLAAAEHETQRQRDLVGECRKRVQALEDRERQMTGYRERLATALGCHPLTPWPSLVAEVETRLAKESTDG